MNWKQKKEAKRLIKEIISMYGVMYPGLKIDLKLRISKLQYESVKKRHEELEKKHKEIQQEKYENLKHQYYERFNLTGENDGLHPIPTAFEKINDIRKFEIELYWKRTAYFWALIAMVFAAYFSFISIGKTIEYRRIYLTLISSMGIVLTFAWLLANKGSKFWQENWENHLDLIEDKVTGPLYKTILRRPTRVEAKKLGSKGIRVFDFIIKPEGYSVSKINQLVGAFIFLVWVLLTAIVLHEEYTRAEYISNYDHFLICLAILSTSMTFPIIILCQSKTHLEQNHPTMKFRTVEISGLEESKKSCMLKRIKLFFVQRIMRN